MKKTSRGLRRCRSIPGKPVYSMVLIFLFAVALFPFGTAAVRAAPAPTIYSITPFSGNVGTEVIIAGADFQASQNDSYVAFGQVKATQYVSWSDSQVKCNVPEGTWGQVEVTVTTDTGTSNTVAFTAPTLRPCVPQSHSQQIEQPRASVCCGRHNRAIECECELVFHSDFHPMRDSTDRCTYTPTMCRPSLRGSFGM